MKAPLPKLTPRQTMDSVVLESVTKIFRPRPALFNCFSQERTQPTIALHEVSLTARSGSILALLGPNGSGKTTLLKLIATVLLPDAGAVRIRGFDTRTDLRRVQSQVGMAIATERSFFPRLTARENLNFFAALDNVRGPARRERIELRLAQTGLLDAADTLVMKFSAGMYQRLAMARALIKKPSVVLLDEPSRSLDPAATEQLWGLIQNIGAEGATVVMATHNFEEALALADSIAILRQGELVEYRELPLRHADDLRAMYFGPAERAPEKAALVETYQ